MPTGSVAGRSPCRLARRVLPGAIASRVGADGVGVLVRGGDIVARAGDDLTLWRIKEIHARP